MRMTAGKRALDKIYKRRDRYEIPDWQRGEVWDQRKKQQLIDSILRGWKLPKFYFQKVAENEYEVVDGQQRLLAIYEFFGNELQLPTSCAKQFGGTYYKELPQPASDSFDDFEIEYDEIEGATQEELKQFFQRLQAGLPLTSSEKLNAVHSRLRDFCRKQAQHPFLHEKVSFPNTRYAHFDVIAKAAAIEIEGLDANLRFEEIKEVFEAQQTFSPSSAIAKRLKATLDLLHKAFPARSVFLRNRTIVQSLMTLTSKIVSTGRHQGLEDRICIFYEGFVRELSRQVELGQAATDSDFVRFQRSVSANVRGGARTRHEVLLRKLLATEPKLAAIFDPTIVAESGTAKRVSDLGIAIRELVHTANKLYATKTGEDLFKATNDTARALTRIGRPIADLNQYSEFMDDLYFLFRESVGSRLGANWPQSFADVNVLRTYLRHDVDHGDKSKVRAKRRGISRTFIKYAGTGTPETLDPTRFVLVQANLLAGVEADLRAIVGRMT